MGIAHRSYLTAGVSLLGVGAIALAPVQPTPNQITATQAPAISTLAVNLAASIDPITPWVNTFKTAAANIKTIAAQQADPGPLLPILSAMGSNWKIYLTELPDIPQIFNQILGNLKAAVTAPLDQNLITLDTVPISANTNNTIGVTCQIKPDCGNPDTKFLTTYYLSTPLVPESLNALIPVANLLSSPLSGALVGFAGPGLSVLAQTVRSFNVIAAALKAKNLAAVINEVINLPANLVNAGLNGGGNLDLTGIAAKLGPALGFNLPEGAKLGLETGGLLSPGVALGGDPLPFKGWSGTAWDAVSAEADTAIGKFFIKGLPVGPIATGLGMRTTIADAITLPPQKSAQSAAPAKAVAAPASAEAAPVVAEAPEAAADAPVVAVESPASKSDSAPAAKHQGAGNSRGSHTGARGKRNAE